MSVVDVESDARLKLLVPGEKVIRKVAPFAGVVVAVVH
jgi:hypothetical protein